MKYFDRLQLTKNCKCVALSIASLIFLLQSHSAETEVNKSAASSSYLMEYKEWYEMEIATL